MTRVNQAASGCYLCVELNNEAAIAGDADAKAHDLIG